MKFGTLLKERLSDLPECENLFTCYKQLKKTLKGLGPSTTSDDSDSDDTKVAPGQGSILQREVAALCRKEFASPESSFSQREEQYQQVTRGENGATLMNEPSQTSEGDGEVAWDTDAIESEFLSVLRRNVEAFNQTYLETEETLVIQMRELSDRWNSTSDVDSLKSVYKDYIDLHGEMLMLMNWSMLAYTSVVKILKKHEKCTGHKLHAPGLEDLMAQPFCATEATRPLVQKCVGQVAAVKAMIIELGGTLDDEPILLHPSDHKSSPTTENRKRSRSTSQEQEDGSERKMYKRAQAALNTWQSLYNQRSTPSNYIAPAQRISEELAPCQMDAIPP